MSNEQTNSDDPSDDRYWRDVEWEDLLEEGDMYEVCGIWWPTNNAGRPRKYLGETKYRRRIEQQANPDDPSGPGWRDVTTGSVMINGDMIRDGYRWVVAQPGQTVTDGDIVRRRIWQATSRKEQTTADDTSGLGWRDLGPKEPIEQGDVYICGGVGWLERDAIGRLPLEFPNLRYRRRIEQPQQTSDSEPETMDDLRQRLAACEVLLAEAGGSGEQVNTELQQLREQVQTLTRERDEHARKAATAHNLAEMSRRQVEDEARKVEQLKTQVQDMTRVAKNNVVELQQLRDQVETLEKQLDENDMEIVRLNVELQEPSKQIKDMKDTIARLTNELAVERVNSQNALQWLKPLRPSFEQPNVCGQLVVTIVSNLPDIVGRFDQE